MGETRKARHFIDVPDLSIKEIGKVFASAERLKKTPRSRQLKMLPGTQVALIFEKPSTRTRVSFEAGISQLGGNAIYLDPKTTQLGRGETIGDTARVISRYCDAAVLRVFNHDLLGDFSRAAGIPTINALSDFSHPCQSLADVFTMYEAKGKLKGLKVAFLGDGGNNTCNSLMQLCAMLGIHFFVACPHGFRPDLKAWHWSEGEAKKNKSRLVVTESIEKALEDADVVYTDTWVSMGLPAHRGEEITSEVLDGRQSVAWQQAENKLHVQKALLLYLLK